MVVILGPASEESTPLVALQFLLVPPAPPPPIVAVKVSPAVIVKIDSADVPPPEFSPATELL
jgi:hypothetical protein